MLVRAANPIWYMVDLTGLPLNDNYYAFFLTNTVPYVPQAPYQDPNGYASWPYVLQFQPSGTLPNNLYFNPDLVYRIEIRKGPDQTYPLIWIIENFVPGSSGSTNTDLSTSQNLITNPQFADVDFVSPYTFTQGSSGTYTIDVGPGWQLVLTGTGTTILTQVENSGSTWTSTIPGNPPYSLTINNSGWTTASLVQTFANNGEIFANGAVSMSAMFKATSVGQFISLIYHPNGPSNDTTVAAGTINPGDYSILSGVIDLPPSENTNSGEAANVQMIIRLQPTNTITITNVQFIGQSVNLSTQNLVTPLFQEISYERIVDQEFHVYKDSLLTEPKSNILSGWTFALNPWQFITNAVTTVSSKTQYIADQTILHQETASSLATGQGDNTVNFGLQVNSLYGASANNRFAIIQYIDTLTIAPYWGQNLSCLVRALFFRPNGASILPIPQLKMRLIYRTTAVPTIGNSEPITGWDANGDLTFASGWTAIEPLNDVNYTLLNSSGASAEFKANSPGYAYDQFQLPPAPNGTYANLPTSIAYLGVVIYINAPLDNTASGMVDYMVFDRVSLVPNDYAIDASPETYDETLRKCQFYYEKSYDSSVLPGTASLSSSLIFPQAVATGGGSTYYWPSAFSINYRAVKRASGGTLKIYSPNSGTVANVYAYVSANSAVSLASIDYATTNYSFGAPGAAAAYAIPASGGANGPSVNVTTVPITAYMQLNYTVNCCLGNPTLP